MAERTLKYFGGHGELKLFDHIGHGLTVENPETFKEEFMAFAKA